MFPELILWTCVVSGCARWMLSKILLEIQRGICRREETTMLLPGGIAGDRKPQRLWWTHCSASFGLLTTLSQKQIGSISLSR